MIDKNLLLLKGKKMAIPHAISGQSICIFPDSADSIKQQSTTIIKTEKLEVMRLILPRGKTMPAHKVTGEITVQCLSGAIDLLVEDQLTVLGAGHMVCLSGGVVHALTATEDACVLVHVLLQR